MNLASFVEKVQKLPEEKQAEVVDFVNFLAERYAQSSISAHAVWSEADFSQLSMAQSLRGLEEEPSIYSAADLKERWS